MAHWVLNAYRVTQPSETTQTTHACATQAPNNQQQSMVPALQSPQSQSQSAEMVS